MLMMVIMMMMIMMVMMIMMMVMMIMTRTNWWRYKGYKVILMGTLLSHCYLGGEMINTEIQI